MAARKHALLIGIKDNPKIRKHESREIRRLYGMLRGCDDDVDLMRNLLVERFGFAGDGGLTRAIKTREATREAILAAVDDLVERVGPGDVAVVYYSGHGSRMRDPFDPDRRLETIVPYDSSRGPEDNRDIPDLEIDRWVRRLNDKTPHVTLIFDCCHSGSITRDPFGDAVREVAQDLRSADEMFAGEVPVFFARGRGRASGPRIRSAWLPAGRRAVTVAACRADQKSYEMKLEAGDGFRFHGVLTYHLAAALADPRRGAMTWRDVHERVAPQVIAEWPAQHPQVEGDIDRLVFGTAQARAKPYLPVKSAVARPVFGVAIEAPGDARGELVERIEASELLSLDRLLELRSGDDPADRRTDCAADVLVRLLEPRTGAAPGDPCSYLGALAVPTWAVVGRDGRLEAQPRPAGDTAAEEVERDLVRLARFQGLRKLENPDPESFLRGRLDLRILDASGEVARPDPERGIVIVEEGDFVDFEIENRYDEKVWVSLIELDCDRSVTLLMPSREHPAFQPGGRELEPGKVLRVGRDYWRAEDGLEQGLPAGFPWPADRNAGQEPGVAFLKLLATSVPSDFEFLELAPMRSAPAHSLAELAWLYQSGSGRRTVVLPAEAQARNEDWTVVTVCLGTRPAG